MGNLTVEAKCDSVLLRVIHDRGSRLGRVQCWDYSREPPCLVVDLTIKEPSRHEWTAEEILAREA